MNNRLSRNITREEVACKCGCGFDIADSKTVDMVQDVADHVLETTGAERVIVNINSWCRCYEHNEVVQIEADPDYIPGSSESTHMLGNACDFWLVVVKDGKHSVIDPHLVYEYLNRKYAGFFGVGKYNSFTHADSKSGPARRW